MTRSLTGTSPATEQAAFHLHPAPNRAEPAALGGSLGMMLMPAASGVGAVVLAVSSQGRPVMAVLAAVVLVASVTVALAMAVSLRSGGRRRTRRVRERYLDHVEHVRQRARHAAVRQHRRSARDHPDPHRVAAQALSRSAGSPRGDLTVRVGVGTVPLDRPVLAAPDDATPLSDVDPACAAAAAAAVTQYTTLSGQPVVVDLWPGCTVLIRGSADRVLALTRAMLTQLVAHHRPTELAILVVQYRCGGMGMAEVVAAPSIASRARRPVAGPPDCGDHRWGCRTAACRVVAGVADRAPFPASGGRGRLTRPEVRIGRDGDRSCRGRGRGDHSSRRPRARSRAPPITASFWAHGTELRVPITTRRRTYSRAAIASRAAARTSPAWSTP